MWFNYAILKIFSISDISSKFGISYSRASDTFRSLRKKGKAKRIESELYQIIK